MRINVTINPANAHNLSFTFVFICGGGGGSGGGTGGDGIGWTRATCGNDRYSVFPVILTSAVGFLQYIHPFSGFSSHFFIHSVCAFMEHPQEKFCGVVGGSCVRQIIQSSVASGFIVLTLVVCIYYQR